MEQIKACIVGSKCQRRRGFRYKRLGGGMSADASPLPLVYAVFVAVSGCCRKNSVGERGEKRVTNAPPWRARHKELFTLLHGKRERSSEPWWIKLESNARGCIIHAICFIHTQKARKIRRLSRAFFSNARAARATLLLSISRAAPHKCEHTSSFLFVVTEHTAKN
jgi:hypothetical protein